MKMMKLWKRGEDYFESTNGLLVRSSKDAVKMSGMDDKGLVAMGWERVANQNHDDHGDIAEKVWEWESEHFGNK